MNDGVENAVGDQVLVSGGLRDHFERAAAERLAKTLASWGITGELKAPQP